jgi:hypothetical protein
MERQGEQNAVIKNLNSMMLAIPADFPSLGHGYLLSPGTFPSPSPEGLKTKTRPVFIVDISSGLRYAF